MLEIALFPHQNFGTAKMLYLCDNLTEGGILEDEMGLEKNTNNPGNIMTRVLTPQLFLSYHSKCINSQVVGRKGKFSF